MPATATDKPRKLHLIEHSLLMEGATLEKQADPKDGVIAVFREVAVLRPESKNRRRYTESARKDAVKVFEGARVMIDHKDTGNTETRVRDLAGSLHGLYIDGSGTVRAKEMKARGPSAQVLITLAESASDICGLSIDADGEGTLAKDGWLDVEHIHRGRSVDVVDRPGSTTNLFESDQNLLEGPIADKLANDAVLEDVRKKNSAAWWLVYQTLDDDKLSASERKAKVISIFQDLVKELGGDSGTVKESADPAKEKDVDFKTLDIATLEKERPDLAKQLRESTNPAIAAAQAEVAALKEKIALGDKRQAARVLVETVLAEEKLSNDTRFGTAVFIESLVAAAVGLEGDAAKAAIKRVIEDRKAIVGTSTPVTEGAPVYPERSPLTSGGGGAKPAAWSDEKTRDDHYKQVVKEAAISGNRS